MEKLRGSLKTSDSQIECASRCSGDLADTLTQGSGWEMRFCISVRSPGDPGAAGPGATLRVTRLQNT
jgi:hypothetical protein